MTDGGPRVLDDRSDLPAILGAIRDRPDEEARWLALASWLRDNGPEDEAAAVRVFWPTLRDNVLVSGVPLHETLSQLAQHAARLGPRAREIESRAVGDWWAGEE